MAANGSIFKWGIILISPFFAPLVEFFNRRDNLTSSFLTIAI